MTQSSRSPSPRQNSPAKTAAEQRLKKLRRTELILQGAAFAGVGLFMVSTVFLSNSVWSVVVVSVVGASWLAWVTSIVRVWIHERKSRMIRNARRACEYDLTGLNEPELCPECGTKIDRSPGSIVQ